MPQQAEFTIRLEATDDDRLPEIDLLRDIVSYGLGLHGHGNVWFEIKDDADG